MEKIEYITITTDQLGTRTVSINPEDIQVVLTPNGMYQFMEGKLVEVPDPCDP